MKNTGRKKILVGMSGGIDSSVAAALLVQQGHQVTGVIMKTWQGGSTVITGKHGCYGPGEEEDVEDARRVSDMLGIPLHVIDLAREYKEEILDYFCQEYLSGRTPNPCTRCNPRIKFGALLERASDLGLDYRYFATGHYARVGRDPASGRYLLKRATDQRKDQSYFLYSLSQQQLGSTIFPLGNLLKSDVRRICTELNLGIENKQESQNFVCGNYTLLFEKPLEPGPLMDKQGHTLGQHRGIVHYTIGQRRGLGISTAEPVYVIDIRPESNVVIVGQKQDLFRSGQTVKELNWIAIGKLQDAKEVRVRIRSSHSGYAAAISPLDDKKVLVTYREPQVAAARGQAVVFYDDDVVLGGGIAC